MRKKTSKRESFCINANNFGMKNIDIHNKVKQSVLVSQLKLVQIIV